MPVPADSARKCAPAAHIRILLPEIQESD